MFTGIIEEIGTVKKLERGRYSAVLTIGAEQIMEDVKLGDSIAVNGVCLTVSSRGIDFFTADVMHETLDRSTLVKLKSGCHVNLERAMPANGRFGGHIVAGHVDGVGRITGIRQDDTAVWFTVEAEPQVLKYIIEKGSVAIDGISLTVARVSAEDFSISAIPHTVRCTVLKERKEGDLVNLENDMIGKYVEKLCKSEDSQPTESRITREFLTRYGY